MQTGTWMGLMTGGAVAAGTAAEDAVAPPAPQPNPQPDPDPDPPTDPGPGTPPEPVFGPVPGILDAANVVILGASIMQANFGAEGSPHPEMEAVFASLGFTGRLRTYAVAGHSILNTQGQYQKARADLAASRGRNLYIVHTGGNDVSSARPWPGRRDDFTARYGALMDAIAADGDRVIPLPLTRRNYTTAPQVIAGDTASEANGSRPYNENVVHGMVEAHAPDFARAGTTPWVNPYEVADRYPDVLGADGIHGYGRALGRYILARIAGRALGMRPGGRAGRTLRYAVGWDNANLMALGRTNTFQSKGDYKNYPLLTGALDTAGMPDPFVVLNTNDGATGGHTGDGDAARARIADDRLHEPEMLARGVYVGDTARCALEVAGLEPGDRVRVTAMGSRNAGGTARRAALSLIAGAAEETVILDASRAAPSNTAAFSEVAVPASGRITLSMRTAPGSKYGYLNGVLLDFV